SLRMLVGNSRKDRTSSASRRGMSRTILPPCTRKARLGLSPEFVAVSAATATSQRRPAGSLTSPTHERGSATSLARASGWYCSQVSPRYATLSRKRQDALIVLPIQRIEPLQQQALEQAFLDLAGRSLGDLVDEENELGPLEVGDVGLAEPLHVLHRQPVA